MERSSDARASNAERRCLLKNRLAFNRWQPGRIVKDVLRVRLDSGDVYDLSCFAITSIVVTQRKRNGKPGCEVVLDNGRRYRVDHAHYYLKDVFTEWQRRNGAAG